RATVRFADHAEHASCFKDLASEFIHTRSRCWTSRAYNFITDWIDWTDVVDKLAFQINRKFFAIVEHVDHTFMCSIATSIDCTVKKKRIAWFPRVHFFLCDVV